MESDTNHILKALVSVVVEESLLKIGDRQLYYKVTQILYQNYKSYIPDCYEHPEYLRKVFSELDGSYYLVALDSIKAKLEEFAYHKPIRKVLENLSEIKINC